MNRWTWLAPGLAICLSGCVVGRDYEPAPKVSPQNHFVRGGDVTVAAPQAGAWWTALNDARLNALIGEALSANSSVEAASARLAKARGLVKEARANRAPSVGGSGTYIKGSLPGGSLGGDTGGDGEGKDDLPIESYNLGFNASWELDLAGRMSRAVERDRAKAQAAEAELEDVRVTLVSDIASVYVNLRDQQARLTLARAIQDLQADRLSLIQQRRQAGAVTAQDLITAEADVDQAQADRIQLESDVELSLNQLAVLVGREPGALDQDLARPAPIPLPPAEVAVGDPAGLLAHRPDVRQAERKLAATTAAIGVATSQYYPQVKFMGLLGMGGPDIADVIDTSNLTQLALPMISWKLLDFGRIDAQVAQSRGDRDEAAAAYRGAMLTALEDAESALSRFGHGRQAYRTAERAADSSKRASALSAQRYRAGAINGIDNLEVRRRMLIAQQQLSQSRANVSKAFVAVQKSLGLGWTS